MTDTITFLQGVPGSRATKMWMLDGTTADYDAGWQFQPHTVPVADLDALAALLVQVQSHSSILAIRGSFLGDAHAQTINRPDGPAVTAPGWYRRWKDLYNDAPHYWMCCDIDSYVPPAGIDPVLDPVRAVQSFIEDSLPPEFDGAAFHWQLSSSAGHPTKAGLLKAHVWFWMDQPHTGAELEAWATNYPGIDRTLFRQVQVHYTALPVFAPGVVDPVPVRNGYVPGSVVPLVLTERMVREAAAVRAGREMIDPRTKTGVIGAFCRAYSIEAVLAGPLADKFSYQAGSDRRLTWHDGRGAPGGAYLSDDRLHLCNEHATSPVGNTPLNAFDAVRVYCFGHLDMAPGVDPLALVEINTRPSHRAAVEWAVSRPEVFTELQMGPPGRLPPATETPTSADPDPVASPISPYPPPFRGMMHEVVQSALAGSTKPQVELCTLSALIGMAAACSGDYRLPSGMRLNLFGCGVAGTGEGKDRPRSIATSLVTAAKGKLIGKPASGPGLEDSLVSTTGSLIALDEIAHFFAAINNGKAPPYLIELAGTLLQLFSASNGNYHTRTRAAARGVIPSRVLRNPMVSLLGFATPEKLGEAMGVSNIEDGLLGRFLFAFGQTGIEPRRVVGSFELPAMVKLAAETLDQASKQVSFRADLQGTSDAIQIDPAAEKQLGELLVEFDKQRQVSPSAFAKALLTRSCEKCERVAGVLAVWDCPAKPVITLEHVTWAEQLLRASDSALLRFSGEYMHGGQTQADGQRILKLIQRTLAGEFKAQKSHEKWLLDQNVAPYSMVMRGSKLDKRRFDDAVAHLADLFDVQSGSTPSGHPNGRAETVRWLSLRA